VRLPLLLLLLLVGGGARLLLTFYISCRELGERGGDEVRG
jgi:hypothetical protein